MCILAVGVACEKRLEQPESVDPVYHALENEQRSAEAAAAAMEKQVEDTAKKFDEAKPMDKMKIQLKRELYQQEAALRKLQERALYQKLQVQKRAAEARIEYDRAYRNKEPWPNPDSFKSYQATERLKKAPKSWSSRVPKLSERKKAAETPKEAPPAH